jgi:hypothetical protein
MNHTMKQENRLIELFPYAARKERKHRPIEDDFPDSPAFKREVLRVVGAVILGFLILIGIAVANWYGQSNNF